MGEKNGTGNTTLDRRNFFKTASMGKAAGRRVKAKATWPACMFPRSRTAASGVLSST